ncbi:PrgI family protein [Candidatus Peregrinibacteria bacterium]|nr:PrgI family protein [Candidatus Peregrinibacteria bacterium]
MPIEAVKIPQNVQIEDRVVGPLSLRQIIIMAIGGGLSYVMYSAVQRSIGHVSIPLTIILWTPAAIAAAFALININDMSLLRICLLLLERIQKPSLRTWAPRTGISITIRTSATDSKDENAGKKRAEVPGQTTEQQIADLTRVVDMPATTNKDETMQAADAFALVPAALPESAENPENAAVSEASVNPDRILADSPAEKSISAANPLLSDLSIFRDVLPPTSSWPS